MRRVSGDLAGRSFLTKTDFPKSAGSAALRNQILESETQTLTFPHVHLRSPPSMSISNTQFPATPSSKQRFISSYRERPSSTSTSTSRLHTHPPIVKLRLQNLASTSLSKSSSSTSSLVGTHRHQTFAMASLNINAQAPENGGIFPFLKLPAEIRNRIYQYTFAAPLGHLEIFDLLEPIPGGALLCRYTLVRFSVNTFADYTMLDTCKQIRAEAKAMYDGARALVQWDYYSFVLNINRPQFDGYEGQRKISKICEVRH